MAQCRFPLYESTVGCWRLLFRRNGPKLACPLLGYESQRLYLDTQQFAKLVQTEAIQLAGVEALTTFQKRLVAIAMQLGDIGYDIDLPGLDAAQQTALV